MEKLLLLQVHLLDGRYHGTGDWPPAPARLFQSLVAGNAVGATVPEDCQVALRWLESLRSSVQIHAPGVRVGRQFTTFVPNNDLDAKGGDPRRVADIRVGKLVRPRYLQPDCPISYGWRFPVDESSERLAGSICKMAENLYQFGRGVDMAWAVGQVLDGEDAASALAALSGVVYRASNGRDGIQLACPDIGSLDSLLSRFQAQLSRFSRMRDGKKVQVYFRQPPKPRFRQQTYNAPNRTRLFDLRVNTSGNPYRSWPQNKAVRLVEKARDAAIARLVKSMPEQGELVERVLRGRGATQLDKAQRVRLIPMPSIGHQHTNRSIRRLLLDVAPDCPLRFDDIEWAFSGTVIDSRLDEETGELFETLLARAEDLSMQRHYGVETDESFRVWRTVTPAALPQQAARRIISPRNLAADAKPGSERAAEEHRAQQAVVQALRHADIPWAVDVVRVQREPFSARGLRAKAFSEETRFAKERLWHVEVQFAEPIEGPLVIGDGRYLGLGVMAPVRRSIGALGFDILDGLEDSVNPEQLSQALRRAVMALVQRHQGERTVLDSFFTGHTQDGSPLRVGNHQHLAFAADLSRRRLLIISPHLLEGRQATSREQAHFDHLDNALSELTELRAGMSGLLKVRRSTVSLDEDPLFGRSNKWRTVTVFRPTRHAKHTTPEDALKLDVLREARRLGLPNPVVNVVSVAKGRRGGLSGHVSLTFKVAQPGPILLGKSRHFGGGLFVNSFDL